VYSRTSDVSIFMCSGGVRWILVMFDVMTYLLCWIVMCMLHFLLLCMCCIFYMPGFVGSLAGEADKIGKFSMFISSPMYIIYVHRLAEEHKFGYVPWFRPRNVSSHMFLGFGLTNVSSDMFLGWLRNISSDVHRCHMAMEHMLCSSAPMSMKSYVRQDIVLSYVPWFIEEHMLCSSATNICSSVFGRGTFVCFLL
jgi:hypothetical protein